MDDVRLTPVGVVRSGRTDLEDDRWGGEVSRIELDAARFTTEALAGIEGFSHLEIVYLLHALPPERVVEGSRHPRGNPDWPRTGIFAQRGAARPNRIGISRVRLLRVQGLTLEVAELDAVDGTPVLDIKPWVQEFGPRGVVRQPAWMDDVMRHYFDPAG